MSLTSIPSISGDISPGSNRPEALTRIFGAEPLRTDGELLALGFASDGSLWSVEEPGVLSHWDIKEKSKSEAHFLDDLATIWTFSRGCERVASGTDSISVWEVGTGDLLANFPCASWVTALAFSPDRQLLASGHDDGMVRVLDLAEHKMLCELKAHERGVSALVFAPDGSTVASSGEEKVIRLWGIKDGKMKDAVMCHHDRIPELLFHPTEPRLISAGWDTTARIWDVTTGKPIILLNSHASQVHHLALSGDGNLLVCADSAQDLHLWDVRTFKTLRVWPRQGSDTRALAFAPDGRTFAAGGEDQVIRLYDVESAEVPPDSTHPMSAGYDVAVSPEGKQLFCLAQGVGLRSWAVENGEPKPVSEAGRECRAMALTPDGKRLIAAFGSTHSLALLDPESGSKQGELQGPKNPVTTLAVSADSGALASSDYNGGDVWIWDLTKDAVRLLIPDAVDTCSVAGLALHPTRPWLAVAGIDWLTTSGSDGLIAIWDFEKGELLRTLPGGGIAVAFHPEGNRLAIMTPDGAIDIANPEDGSIMEESEGHIGGEGCLAYSPDGSLLATSGNDFTLRVRNGKTYELLGSTRLSTQIKALCFSADNRYLFTSNGNGSSFQLEVAGLQ